MANDIPTPKKRTFETWLDNLATAAEGVISNSIPIEKALALSRVTDSAMKVINTAVNVAQMRHAPKVLSNMIGNGDLIIEDEDAAVEIAGRIRGELSIVAQELAKDNLSPSRKAFLNAKRLDLESKLRA